MTKSNQMDAHFTFMLPFSSADLQAAFRWFIGTAASTLSLSLSLNHRQWIRSQASVVAIVVGETIFNNNGLLAGILKIDR